MSAPVILVVEDNDTTRKLVRLTLQAEGYEVLEAENGGSALRIVAEQMPGLVLLDFGLPDMDGHEVSRRLHLLAPTLPVIAVSGSQPIENAGLPPEFVETLLKPVEPSLLVEAVQRHLGRGSTRAPDSSRRRVLLVDDDPMQRKLARLALGHAGFDVIVAEDGNAALRLASESRPDAVVSDVLMPEMDGFTLCQALRKDAVLASVPVVLMSAHYLEPGDRELAAQCGASRYISRSHGFDAVVSAVLDVIDAPAAAFVSVPDEALQEEHLRRVAHQLALQTGMGLSLARRVSLQASALSVLEVLSDTLAGQLDPENALDDTLAKCLDATGLSVGAILLFDESGPLKVKAHVGSKAHLRWEDHSMLLNSISAGTLVIPSVEAGAQGDQLLGALSAGSGLVVPIIAREEALGVLLLASNTSDLAGTEAESAVRAARSVSMQLGQALALARTFSKLGSAEQRYRALFENARDAIGILDHEGVVLEANQGWETLIGLPLGQIVGHHLSDFAPGVWADATPHDPIVGAPQEGASSLLISIQQPGGGVVQVEVSRTAVEVGGTSYVLLVGRDVSERLRLEEQLLQSQKMEAVGRLAGGIAHDFNNLLSVILSLGEILLADMKIGDPMRADIQQIHKAGERAAGLTKQLLAFSRQQVIEPKVIDLNEVLAGIHDLLERLLGADVDFMVLPAPHLGRVRADPGTIGQVIMNLVVNARDAMPTGGKLTVETANVVLDDACARQHLGVKAGPHVMLAVSDSGTGMDKATVARVFEPFFTTKEQGKGTGLGLSTVYGIVQQSGGSVWVYSELGKGTTFKVYLPRVDDAADELHPLEAPQQLLGSETILLAEDDDQVRAVACGILRRCGYTVIEARNAGEALMHSEGYGHVIHLLITDVVMPQISGPDLAKRLAIDRPAMKVLYVSGYTDDSIVRHGVLQAHTSYLQKPITPGALASKVREILDGLRSQRPN